MKSLTLWRVARRSGSHFFKSHLAVILGIAAATAVIVGALVVGDSVRGSLRGLVLDRLANVQGLLHSRTFFDPQLVESLAVTKLSGTSDEAHAAAAVDAIVEMIYLPSATVEHRRQQSVQRSSKVQVFGVDASFWKSMATSDDQAPPALNDDEIVLGSGLAAELNAGVGDELTIRMRTVSGVPADNPLGQRDDTSLNLPRQKIVAILPDRGLGGLSFQSTQSLPRNVFCSLETLQDLLECGAQVNAALVTSAGEINPPPLSAAACRQLSEQLRPSIEDYGLKLERVTQRFPENDRSAAKRPENQPPDDGATRQTIYDYYQLTSNELILDDVTADAVLDATSRPAFRLLAYLGNTLSKVEPLASDLIPRFQSSRSLNPDPARLNLSDSDAQVLSRPVPYSIVVGIQGAGEDLLGQHTSLNPEELRSPYCWINSWLAKEIDAAAGDWVEIRFFEPETIDGVERERSVRCMVAGIVPLTEPVQGYQRNRPARYESPPTIFNDPNLTPTVPGLTDKDSIANWEAPFKLDLDLILPADDEYYANHRLTPKLFLPYRFAASRGMFGSRFGHTTAIRFPAENDDSQAELRQEIETALLTTRASRGFSFVPVRQQLLQSAAGTTPFDMLFLSLSFFVIVAALLLVALLFKLGITQRASQLGLLAAQGFTAGRIQGLLLRELSGVALVGAGLGILLGVGYARLMIAALESWWVGAITNPFLSFTFSVQSLLIGAVAGMLMSLITIYFSVRKLSRLDPLQLLRGQTDVAVNTPGALHHGWLAVAGFLVLGAVGLIVAAMGQTGMARAGSFFGSGMLLLLAALVAVHQLLAAPGFLSKANPTQTNLLTLARGAIRRNPLRSSMALGLLSVASFLIASMSIFHVTPDPRGYGGFDWIGESSLPIYRNLSSASVRQEVLGEQAQKLRDTLILPFRVRAGEDASCNNLFQVAQPTILGVPNRISQLNNFGDAQTKFSWAAAAAPQDPWSMLQKSATGDESSPIPVILDQNTAAWSLKQGASLDAVMQFQYGPRTIYFRTVGLLANSVLQGKLMIGDNNFRQLFPEISGSQFFLIRTGETVSADEVNQLLEQGWSAEGLDLTSSAQVLAGLLGVQNTYISAFQSLGALGLLLGTFGLIAVQLRSVVERRHELALMQAVGFSQRRISRMLTLETALLLGGGLLIGCLAAAVALIPYLLENGTQVSALQPLAMLLLVLLVGFIASFVAVRAALRRSILAGLRSA